MNMGKFLNISIFLVFPNILVLTTASFFFFFFFSNKTRAEMSSSRHDCACDKPDGNCGVTLPVSRDSLVVYVRH